MADNNDHPFDIVTPDYVIQAVESQGFLSDGRNLALNSYENRVYQVGIEDADPIIAKFYRPGRWTREQILEEHAFVYELLEQDLPVVAPMRLQDGSSIFEHEGIPIALFVRKGGRAPELDNLDHLYELGQSIGRIHCVGKAKPFTHRPELNIQTYGYDSMHYVAEHSVPEYLRESYETLCQDLLKKIESIFAEVHGLTLIRTHGDCHIGNILWRDEAPHYVDFDDCRMAPAIQDLWMFLSGDRQSQITQMSEILEGYEMFNDFNMAELRLIEPLRTLRMMHYCAWLSRRWNDPAFPMHFPWFNTERYWGEHILELREQFSALDEPVLELRP